MTTPIWRTPAGSLGVIPEATLYEFPLDVYDASGSPLTFKVIAGTVPAGMSISSTGLVSGTPTAVTDITTHVFTVRVSNNSNKISDRTFSLTIGGLIAPIIDPDSGSLGSFIDGTFVNIQLAAIEPVGDLVPSYTLVDGALPPGLSLTSSGKISGYILPAFNPIDFGPVGPTWTALSSTNPNYGPGFDWQNPDYSAYTLPFDFTTFDVASGYTDKNYQFTIQVSDGVLTDVATYTIFVYTRQDITADMDTVTADNVSALLTADEDTVYNPLLLTPEGSLGTLRQNTLFQYKMEAKDLDGDLITYNTNPALLPTGLSLNPSTGWITGIVPYGPLGSVVYPFTVNVSKVTNGITYTSENKNYSLKLQGQIVDTIEWLTDSNLGNIFNGAISELKISASTPSNRVLNFALVNTSVGGLPKGLSLLEDGTISGRVSFYVGSKTAYTFTVAAFDNDNLVYDEKTFTINVVKRDQQPYENLYIQVLPNREQRSIYDSVVNNSDIFPVDDIYRYNDPWFGKNTLRRSLFQTGLSPLEVADYVSAMSLNHYWKKINFGSVKTAQALDDNFNVKYEVVYLELIDNATNSAGLGPNLAVSLPHNSANVSTIYPNSFPNMEKRITAGVGYENRSILPEWMTSRQPDGKVLGFTRALVLCYAVPGKSAEIAFRVNQVVDQFKLVDFTIDRYEWDSVLSDFWIKGNVTGTGNITANTQSANVTGDGTNFVYELTSNSVVYSNNVAIGIVDQVFSSNLLSLTANASANISTQPFNYTHTFIVNNYATGSGTITSSTNSNVIIGSNTTVAGTGNISGTNGSSEIHGDQYTSFNTELRVGKVIYVANVAIGSVASVMSANLLTLSDPLSATLTSSPYTVTGNLTAFTKEIHIGDVIISNNVVLGNVKTITDDFALVLSANANANVSDQTFTHTTTDPYTTPGQGDKYLKFPNIRVITSEFTTPEY